MKGEFDFFDRPAVKTWAKRLFYAVLVLLVLADFFVTRHAEYGWDRLAGSYAAYGFFSCVVIVAVSKILCKLWLQKGEDYYD